jgi:hypothetical protein
VKGEGGKTPTQLGPLERANLIHGPDLVSKTLCFVVSKIADDGESPNLVILIVIHHHQNPLSSACLKGCYIT